MKLLLTLSDLNLIKEIKKETQKHNQTSKKQIDISFTSISETVELFGKDPNYGLITQNGIIRHFIVFIKAEEVRRLVIPIGITRSERV